MRVGTGFCIFALALVLIDTLYLEWNKEFPNWPTITAGAIAWGLMVWPAALNSWGMQPDIPVPNMAQPAKARGIQGDSAAAVRPSAAKDVP